MSLSFVISGLARVRMFKSDMGGWVHGADGMNREMYTGTLRRRRRRRVLLFLGLPKSMLALMGVSLLVHVERARRLWGYTARRARMIDIDTKTGRWVHFPVGFLYTYCDGSYRCP